MRLPFIDLETTGLDPEKDFVLEVGCVVVDLPTFEEVAAKRWVVGFNKAQPSAKGLNIHPKVLSMHTLNGLWQDCEDANTRRVPDGVPCVNDADAQLQRFLLDHDCQDMQLAGANPGFDRGFMRKHLPGAEKLLHYRNFDTNTFWLLQSFITGEEARREKPASHRALDDCRDAIKQVELHFDFFSQLVKGQ
jgi:oligoribonuclease